MRELQTLVGEQAIMVSDSYDPAHFGVGRLFHVISDAVIVANARTEEIVLWNRAAEKLFGYSTEEALNIPLHSLVPEDLRDVHRAGIANFQRHGRGNLIDSGHPVEVEGLGKSGDRIAVELTLTQLPRASDSEDRYALAVIRDARDRKAAEEARVALMESEIRKKQALEVNDTIVQGLVTASMAAEIGSHEEAAALVRKTLRQAQSLVAGLLREIYPEGIAPGDLKRDSPLWDEDKSESDQP